jgi:hypothetical protein
MPNTYPLPASKPDTSLPPISRTREPALSPQVVDPSALSDVPQKALSDQLDAAQKQARMKAKLDEIKQRFNWTTDKAWNYLANVLMDKDFQVEVEESPEPVGASLAQNQEIVRHRVTAQLAELDAELRREHPGLTASDRLALSETRDPELHRYARAVESGEAWRIRKEPVYRYTEEIKAPAKSLRESLNLPHLVKAKEPADEGDNRGLVMVMAGDGSIDHLELV